MDRLFIFLLCFYFVAAKIKINHINVPHSIESGSVNEVILDCDYDVGGDSGVEVKWYYNGTHNQIYQWIPETQRPGQASGSFKELIDTTYKVSNDKTTMYRALHIVDITPELSGNYTCKVSGVYSEDEVTQSMIIYDAADDGLHLTVLESDSVALCTAGGLYPEPNMTLYIRNLNDSEIIMQQDEEMTEMDDEGFFNVTATLYFDSLNLTGTFQYVCELTIPGTDYQLQEQTLQYIDTSSEETDALLWMELGPGVVFDNVTDDGNSTEELEDESEARLGNEELRFGEGDEKSTEPDNSSAALHSSIFVTSTLLLMMAMSQILRSS